MFESKGLPKHAPRPVIYLSGFISKDKGVTAAEEVRLLWERGRVRYRCFSHAFCHPQGVHYSRHVGDTLTESVKKGMRIMMDSGAFSFHQAGRAVGKVGRKTWSEEEYRAYRDSVIKSYVDFCREKSEEWDFYVTFDYKIHASTVYKMTMELRVMGMRPVPVFHGDDGMEWFRNYCRHGHKLICIGGSKVISGRTNYRGIRNYYDIVFNEAAKFGVGLHALAQTATSFMFQYPWESVDSATWARVASHGCILALNSGTGQVGPLHVSERHSEQQASYNRMSKNARRQVERMVEDEGFDFQQLRKSPFWRSIYNARMFSTRVMEWKETIEKGRVEWASLL